MTTDKLTRVEIIANNSSRFVYFWAVFLKPKSVHIGNLIIIIIIMNPPSLVGNCNIYMFYSFDFYHIKSIFIFIEEKIDSTLIAIDQEEIIGSNIEKEVEKVGLLVSDKKDVSNENGDGGNESDDNDENENDDHAEGDNKLEKDDNDDEDSKSSSSNEEEDTSSANPSIHFFFKLRQCG